MLARAVASALKSLRHVERRGCNCPRLCHEMSLAVPQSVRASMQSRSDKLQLSHGLFHLRIPPIITLSWPLKANGTPRFVHSTGNLAEIPKQISK
eukprot:2597419-Pyramimonas_sp.AAC.1